MTQTNASPKDVTNNCLNILFQQRQYSFVVKNE